MITNHKRGVLPIKTMRVLDTGDIMNEYGFSIYKGAVIVWDEDYDKRVFQAVDKFIERGDKVNGAIFGEHEGVLCVNAPWMYLPIEIEIDDDNWTIQNESPKQ